MQASTLTKAIVDPATPPSFPKGVVPNAEAQSMPNLVPGAEMLGYGLNIFANYSFDSALSPLFKLGAPANWTAPSDKVYQLPANVPPPGGSSATASAQAFATSSAFASYFQGSASVSGSIGAFSASFSAAYSTSQQDSSTYDWALVEADYLAWHVGINYSPAILLDGVKNDPDWSLPQTFDPNDEQNTLRFFRFFQKFGTHFISNVSVGGALYYYFAVQTSAHYDSSATEVSASAEFHGLISSTQASANAQWGQCSANWTSNRRSHVVTVPATANAIDWVNPPAGSYDQNGNFAAWKQAVLDNPSRCKFSLMPIWSLFSGSQWVALQTAFAAYASNRVTVRATTAGVATILVNGSPVIPPGGYPAKGTPAWQVVVLDRKTLARKLNKLYTFDFNAGNWPDGTLNTMANDLQPYAGSKEYMLVTATSDLDEGCSPNAALYAMLKSFGADKGLDAWMTRPHACSGGYGSAVYALVGAGAPVQGCEGFGDTYMSPPYAGNTVIINALLLPLAGSFSPTPYQP